MSSESTENVVNYPDRPGCITAYTVLLWLGGGALVLAALSSFSDPSFGPLAPVGLGLFALLLIVIGIGLWRMQPWSWWLVVIIQSLGVLYALLSLVGGGILYALVSGAISGGILYWFINNRRLFLGPFTHHTGVDPDGKPGVEGAPAPKRSNTTVIIVGVILAVFLVPACIIAVLTLLGPQIGAVFSQIVNELSTP